MAPPAATIPASASASSSPNTQRGNKLSRKSGLSVALQNQALVHPQPTQPSAKNNSNNNGRRNPEQTHLRHHSMPAHQRPVPSNSSKSEEPQANKKVTILKRSSTTALATTASQDGVSASGASNSSPKQQHAPTKQHQQYKQQFNRHQQKVSQQQQQQQHHTPSKARRVQRRKEIEVVQESLAKADLDAATMEHSPPLNALASPPSSTDSDDSESGSSSRSPRSVAGNQKGGRVAKSNSNSNSGGNSPSSGASRQQLATSPPQRPSSAPVLPQGRKGMPAPAVTPHQTGYRGQNHNYNTPNLSTQYHPQQQGHIQRKSSFGSASTLPLDTSRPNVTKTSSADKVVLADRVAAEKAKLYAGPTFHNSPAPTSLPIPAFSRSLSGSPLEPSAETLPTTFAEASSPHLNSSRQRTQSDNYSFNAIATTKPMSVPGYPLQLAQGGVYPHGHHPQLSPYHAPPPAPQHPYQGHGYGYNVPDRMATSSFAPVNNNGQVDHLMEISHNLRTLLKIQSQ
ncbi:hypothetical protein DFQ27_003492 [Actinomortierella ambigua]|uniref:Uncharacterized protein n=1 Tax=Actinomortierella ambigua TaxID=1343610 RepID=A0A9P6U5F4_9FUNG|nr:hypothetical protein DFQ27_003492 [Actinomortierella ambigua]